MLGLLNLFIKEENAFINFNLKLFIQKIYYIYCNTLYVSKLKLFTIFVRVFFVLFFVTY